MIIIKYHEWLTIQPDIRQTIYELCSDGFKAKRQITKEGGDKDDSREQSPEYTGTDSGAMENNFSCLLEFSVHLTRLAQF